MKNERTSDVLWGIYLGAALAVAAYAAVRYATGIGRRLDVLEFESFARRAREGAILRTPAAQTTRETEKSSDSAKD